MRVFKQLSKLASINIPSTVTTIGDFGFLGCRKLSEMVIPDTVTTIGKDALKYDGFPYTINLNESSSYGWTESGGVYSSSNAGKDSTTSSMSITFSQAGTFKFSYMSSGESNYDYLIVSKNGTTVFDRKGSPSTTYYEYTINV